MVFTNGFRFLLLSTAALLAALIAAPSNLSAQLPSRSPRGIIQIGGDGWDNPVVDGLRVQVKWADIQPDNETEFDWSSIDQQVANSQAYQKHLGLSLNI